MSRTVRVNVRTAVNANKIRHERRNGRDVVIVPSATMPDNIVMNGVRYPAAVIAKSFASLENTPAPLGHPNIEGAFVSASEPEGMVRGFIGAWNKNVRREGGRVWVDKVIDVEYAKQLEGGRTVLNAIDKGEPIHTSTGLFCTLAEVTNSDDGAEWEADDVVFDHDAILIGEDGAATPEKGVGIFVNSAGDQKRVEVINSELSDSIERDLDWHVEGAARAAKRLDDLPLLERLKEVIKSVIAGENTAATTEEERESFSVNEEQFNDLKGKVEALNEGLSTLDDKIAAAVGNALKPISDQFEAQANAAKEKAEADHAALANKVVEAGLLDEETAKVADAAVLNALLEKNKPGTAITVNAGGFKPNGKDFNSADFAPE